MNGLHRFLFWCFIMIIFGLIMAMGAYAGLRGNKEACVDLSRLVIQAGDMRDAGVSWDIVQTRLLEVISDSRKSPDTYIANDAEADFVVSSVRRLWNDKDQPSFVTATAVYQSCMGKQAASIRKVS